MKIIKAGNKNRLLQIKRFQCQRCGCIFEATKDEYYSDRQYNDILMEENGMTIRFTIQQSAMNLMKWDGLIGIPRKFGLHQVKD